MGLDAHAQCADAIRGVDAELQQARGHRRIINHSQLDLKDVGIVRRPRKDERVPIGAALEGIWIGDLGPSDSQAASFLPLRVGENEIPFAVERQAAARRQSAERLDIDELLRLAYDPKLIAPGETRLIGRVDGVLPGQTITPVASQLRGATLVVAHLGYGPRPPARPDANTSQDVMREEDDERRR